MANCKHCMHWNRCESRGNTPMYREDNIVENVEEVCRRYEAFEDYIKIPATGIGDLSDGYHTFNELYHHRAVLFSVICRLFPERAWKSKLHDTGDMFEGMFIVGIDTDLGQATYHYDIDPYWDMFEVTELEKAPTWDGHTPAEAIARIATLHMTGSPAMVESQQAEAPEVSDEGSVSAPDETGDSTPEGKTTSES